MRIAKRAGFCCILWVLVVICCGCAPKTKDSYATKLDHAATQDALTRAFYDDITLDITPPAGEEGSAAVEVTIPDLAAIYRANRDTIQTIDSVEALKDLLRAHLGEHTTTTVITETVYKDGTTWKLRSTAQVDALIGEAVDALLSAAADEIGIQVKISEDEMARLVEDVEAMGDAHEKAD